MFSFGRWRAYEGLTVFKKKWYPPERPANYRPDFHSYETLKQAWLEQHPRSTPEEYQTAMRQIAWMCKI